MPSYDQIGNIIVFNEKISKENAKSFLSSRIKTVAYKSKKRSGKYRLMKLKVVAGSRNTETIHKEFGYYLKLDPKEVYFSPRESTERQRIAEQVKPKEDVLVMFSGICPMSIAISKKQPKVNKIYSIEVNPKAYKYAEENIKLNKLNNVIENYKGDVKKVLPKLNKKFDRIIMPLPKQAHNYLRLAFNHLNNKGIIHFYYFDEGELDNKLQDLINNIGKETNRKTKIIQKKKVLPYSPRIWKMVLDIKSY